MKIAALGLEDVDAFWRLRLQLFKELGEVAADADVRELETATKTYYLHHLQKDFVSWGAFDDNQLIALCSLCLIQRLPYQENLSGREGYLLNVYTCPAYRRQGIAGRLIGEVIKYAEDSHICRLWLNSSEAGKRLYTQLGFEEKGDEMERFLPRISSI